MTNFLEGQKTSQIDQTVNLDVIFAAPYVIRQSQKKDISPSQVQKEIKCVTDACCVSHCLCAQKSQKCPSCCQKSTCGRLSAKVLAGLAPPGFKSKGSVHTKGRVLPTLQSKTPSDKVALDSQWICKPGQKQTPKIVLTGPDPKTGSRKSDSTIISDLLQWVVSGAKAQQQVEAHSRSQSTELLPSTILLQDGNSRDHQTLPSTRGVGHLAGFQQPLLSYSDKSKVAEVLKIPSQQSNLSVHCSSFWPVTRSVGVHKGRQGSQADGTGTGYSNPPVPRRLVTQSPLPGNMPMTYPDPLGPLSRPGLGGQSFKVRADSPAGIQFCRLSFRPLSRSGQTHSGEVDSCHRQSTFCWDFCWRLLSWCNQKQIVFLCSVRLFMSQIGLLTATEKQVVSGRLHMRPIQWHLKKHCYVPEALEKLNPLPKSLHVHLWWWLDPNNVLKGHLLHPLHHALQLFTKAGAHT